MESLNKLLINKPHISFLLLFSDT